MSENVQKSFFVGLLLIMFALVSDNRQLKESIESLNQTVTELEREANYIQSNIESDMNEINRRIDEITD